MSNPKLTWPKARTIRKKYATGKWTQKDLAARYGVSQMAIWQVLNNRSWKEKPEPKPEPKPKPKPKLKYHEPMNMQPPQDHNWNDSDIFNRVLVMIDSGRSNKEIETFLLHLGKDERWLKVMVKRHTNIQEN